VVSLIRLPVLFAVVAFSWKKNNRIIKGIRHPGKQQQCAARANNDTTRRRRYTAARLLRAYGWLSPLGALLAICTKCGGNRDPTIPTATGVITGSTTALLHPATLITTPPIASTGVAAAAAAASTASLTAGGRRIRQQLLFPCHCLPQQPPLLHLWKVPLCRRHRRR
jgi:hypothetical protein